MGTEVPHGADIGVRIGLWTPLARPHRRRPECACSLGRVNDRSQAAPRGHDLRRLAVEARTHPDSVRRLYAGGRTASSARRSKIPVNREI